MLKKMIILWIKSIKPTVFFIKEKDELLQAVDLLIQNSDASIEAKIDVHFGSSKRCIDIGNIVKGEGQYRIYLSDIQQSSNVIFTLITNGKVQDSKKIRWKPQRHWKIYWIPISHHDLGFTNSIEKVFNQYDQFYDDILRFCEETEDWPEESKFRYSIEETWSIQHYIKNKPRKVINKIIKYLKEGRIEIPAFYGNEISSLCGHEELIRLMYPSFQLKRELGANIETASITDIPGLSWGLPTILARAGIKYFFAGLPTYFQWGRNDIHTFWDESTILRHGRPDAFRWQGPDGKNVLVYYQGGYGNLIRELASYKEAISTITPMLEEMEKKGCPFSILRYGWGCVDNTPPDLIVCHLAREWNEKWAFPKLIVATNTMFFRELEKQCKDLRIFKGNLPHTDYVVGATSTAKETGINRITHDRLHSAEKIGTVASLITDYPYPTKDIREAYENMILFDEHTWGMARQLGEIQDWNWSDKSHYVHRALGLTKLILYQSTGEITKSIVARSHPAKAKNKYIIVFNPLSIERTDIVRLNSLSLYPFFYYSTDWFTLAFEEEAFELVDEESGNIIPCQIIKLDNPKAPSPYAAHRYARGQFFRSELYELVFVAENVPSLGYKTYKIVPKEKKASPTNKIIVNKTSLENRFYKITLEPKTGSIASIYDKELKRELIDYKAPHKMNQFIARQVKTGIEETEKKTKIKKGEQGPIYGSLVVSGEGVGCPQITQEIILYNKVKRIDFANRILKDSTAFHEIYFAFPFLVENPRFHFEGSNSVINPFIDQFPGSNTNYYAIQHWADVNDSEISITLSPIESHLLEFGGLWPCYVSQAHHGLSPQDFGKEFVRPSDINKGYMYSFILNNNFQTNFQPVQQADMLFRYSITSHKGDWKDGKARNFGWGIGNPLIPFFICGEKKEGELPFSMSFCQISEPNVFLSTLKKAEDGDGIILRLIETEGLKCTATVKLPSITISEAYQTNIVEDNEDRIPNKKHSISILIKSFSITTIRIKLHHQNY
jgi:hypothetical protein